MEFKSSGLQVSSTAFNEGGAIPRNYTCDGANISPPLQWASGPAQTKSYALIMDDPDAPRGTFTHWVLFNLPADKRSLPENVTARELQGGTARQGTNDFKSVGYGGPCPPSGTHRYYFRLYALDNTVSLDTGASKQDLLRAMEGHILAQGQLMGTYQRQK